MISGITVRLNLQLFRIVRVGSVPPPKKTVDVPPVAPPPARQANVHDVVLLEITIATTGAVKAAKVLRGHPLLNQAALDAVKQWRYTPTEINGEPLEVLMTVSVDFPEPGNGVSGR